MTKWLLALIALPIFIHAQNLTEALVKSIPGSFQIEERGDGAYKVRYTKGALKVGAVFPGKPAVAQDKITHISTAPIIQLSLMTLPKGDLTALDQATVILNSVKTEYDKIGLTVNDVRLVDEKSESIGGKRGSSISYQIDLSNGIREYLTVKVASVDGVDVIPFTRVILSPQESQVMNTRVQANSAAANFFTTLSIL